MSDDLLDRVIARNAVIEAAKALAESWSGDRKGLAASITAVSQAVEALQELERE